MVLKMSLKWMKRYCSKYFRDEDGTAVNFPKIKWFCNEYCNEEDGIGVNSWMMKMVLVVNIPTNYEASQWKFLSEGLNSWESWWAWSPLSGLFKMKGLQARWGGGLGWGACDKGKISGKGAGQTRELGGEYYTADMYIFIHKCLFSFIFCFRTSKLPIFTSGLLSAACFLFSYDFRTPGRWMLLISCLLPGTS